MCLCVGSLGEAHGSEIRIFHFSAKKDELYHHHYRETARKTTPTKTSMTK